MAAETFGRGMRCPLEKEGEGKIEDDGMERNGLMGDGWSEQIWRRVGHSKTLPPPPP